MIAGDLGSREVDDHRWALPEFVCRPGNRDRCYKVPVSCDFEDATGAGPLAAGQSHLYRIFGGRWQVLVHGQSLFTGCKRRRQEAE